MPKETLQKMQDQAATITSEAVGAVEKFAKEANRETAKKTRPLARKYPLTFAMLTTFGIAAVLQGFQMTVGQMAIFERFPFLLLFLGIAVLFYTGSLYKKLMNR